MLFREIQCCHAFMKVLEEKMEELPLSHKASNDTNVPGRISKYCTSNCLCVFLFVLKSRVIHRGCQCSVKQCLKHLNDSGHLRSFLLGFHILLSHRVEVFWEHLRPFHKAEMLAQQLLHLFLVHLLHVRHMTGGNPVRSSSTTTPRL